MFIARSEYGKSLGAPTVCPELPLTMSQIEGSSTSLEVSTVPQVIRTDLLL